MKKIGSKKIEQISGWIKEQRQRTLGVLVVFFVLVWMPYYITYFPGIVRTDEMLCVQQAMGDLRLSNHQPAIFVFFLWIVIKAVKAIGGSANSAIAVATVIQMLFWAFVVAMTVLFIMERNNRKWIHRTAILFFAFSPIVAYYSVVLSKDTFFTGWVVLYFLQIYQICKENLLKKKSIWLLVKIILLSSLVGISKSNGFYVLIAMSILLWVKLKEDRKKLIVYGIGTVLVVSIIKGPVYNLLQIEKPSVSESFSVPLQQIGNSLSQGGTFSDSDMEYLDRILPLEDWQNSYTAGITDPIKFHERFKRSYLDQTAGEFLKVWGENLIPNFKYYVQAYLEQMRGYWDITRISNVEGREICENSYGIERIDLVQRWLGFSIEPICFLAVQAARKLPIVNLTTNQVTLAMICVVAWILQLKRKDYRKAIAIMPLLLQWLTLLVAAPASSELRYMLSFHVLLPMIFGLFIMPESNAFEKER